MCFLHYDKSNVDAEEIMKCFESEEEKIAIEEQTSQTFHLCVADLVIDTLYCAKGNLNFGVS